MKKKINDPRWDEYKKAYEALEGIKVSHSDFTSDTVEIGKKRRTFK